MAFAKQPIASSVPAGLQPESPSRRWSDIMDELSDGEDDVLSRRSKASSDVGHGLSTDAGSSSCGSESDSSAGDDVARAALGRTMLKSSAASFTPPRTTLKRTATLFKPPQTSVMLRNIPCRFSDEKVRETLDAAGLCGRYDAVHVPMNPSRTSNKGYGFVNFLTNQDAQHCIWHFDGYPFGNTRSAKLCEVKWATLQGAELIGKFKDDLSEQRI